MNSSELDAKASLSVDGDEKGVANEHTGRREKYYIVHEIIQGPPTMSYKVM